MLQKFLVALLVGVSLTAIAQPTAGLVAYYPFSGNANDASGNGLNLTPFGSPTLTTDRFGIANSAYHFDGSNYLFAAVASGFPTGNGARTIAFWIYSPDYNQGAKDILGWGTGANDQQSWIMMGNAVARQLAFWGYFNDMQSGIQLINGNWHFIVFTHDGTTSKFYIDGIETASEGHTYNTAINSGFEVGSDVNTIEHTDFVGKLDDIRIYDRAINACEVLELYHEGDNIPAICTFTPTSGPVGTSVTITGTNFSSTLTDNIVYFGATQAIVTSATATQLVVTVPVGATYQPITVTVNGLTSFSSKPFIVTFSCGGNINASSFSAKVDFTTGATPDKVSIGDLDGDGKADLVVANLNGNSISIFRNTSSVGSIAGTSFAAKVDFATGTQPFRPLIADVDVDGKLDMVVANIMSNTISIFRNTSISGVINAGSFALKVDFNTNGQPYVMAIGDIDGDGKPDLVSANYGLGGSGNTVSVFRNVSTPGSITLGSFESKVDYTVGNSPYGVVIANIDGDGKPDLVTANASDDAVSVLRNTSVSGSFNAGTFAPKVDFTTGDSPNHVSIGDMDGDGKPDLVVGNNIGKTISVLRNTSITGTITLTSFALKVDFPTGVDPYDATISDMDGDGKPDLVIGNNGSNTVSILKNKSTSGTIIGSSFDTKVDFQTGNNPYGVAIGDLDGDSKPDIVTANFSSNSVSVLRNVIVPTISSFSPSSGPIGTTVTITGNNFSCGTTDNIVWFGATQATVTSATSTQLVVTVPPGATYQPITVSVNNLIAFSKSPFTPTYICTTTIARNNFIKNDLSTSTGPQSIDVGDLDLDGLPDLVIANTLADNFTVIRNQGTGSFDVPFNIGTGDEPFEIRAVDVDGDSKKDIIVQHTLNKLISIYRNISAPGSLSAGSFAAPINFTGGNIPQGITLMDFDDDGKTDMAFSNVVDNNFYILKNTSTPGSISFVLGENKPTGTYPQTLCTADFDGDGKYDVAMPNYNDFTISIFRNTSTVGNISMTSAGTKSTGSFPFEAEAGDFDGDGKMDIVVSNAVSSTVSVFLNTSIVGAISFANKKDFSVGDTCLKIGLGDLDGDSKIDIAVANQNTNNTSLLRNICSPGFINFETKVDFASGIWAWDNSIADLNSDGKPDIVVANRNNNNISVFTNNNWEPPAQATNLVFSNITPTSMDVAYTAASGTPDGYLVVRKLGSAPLSATPVDGTTYVVGGTINDGTVAYVGPALTFPENSLTACSDFYYQVYAYNGSGSCIDYLATSPLAGNQSTGANVTPTVSIAITPSNTICAGTSVTFTATPANFGGGTVTYDFKVNGSSAQSSASNSFTSTTLANGNAVTCDISIAGGTCLTSSTASSNSIAMTVNPNLTPTVSIAASPSNVICAGTSVTFTATSANFGGGTVTYNFKINGSSVQSSASNTFTSTTLSNGNAVTCDISIAGGTCLTSSTATSNSIAMTVNPNLTPTVSIAVSPSNTICAGTSVTFTASALNTGGGTVTYDFKVNGSSVQSSASNTFTSTTLSNGNAVTCDISIAGGTCLTSSTATSNSIAMTVNPNLTPSVSIAVSPSNTICAGTSVTFTATPANFGGGTVTYNFKINGSSVQSSASSTFTSTTLANGNAVTCDISIAGGTCLTSATAISNSIAMTVNPNLTPTVSIAVSPSNIICAGASVTFTATPINTGGGTVTYDFKVNGSSVQSSASNSFTSTTLANGNAVTCDISIAGGTCLTSATAISNSIAMTVNPNLTPSVSIAVSPSNTICAGTSVTFTATPANLGGGTVTYNFKVNGSSVQSSASNTFTSTTLANGNAVTCDISIVGGTCLTIATATSNSIAMVVNPNLTPTVSISVSPSNTICAATSVTFTATPTNTGGGTVTYNFKVNGSSVQSSASNTYTSTTLANGNAVTCDISIAGGTCLTIATATSNSIAMTVNPNLTPTVSIAASPSNTICAGTSVMFTATPTNTGGGTVTYNFKVNGTSKQNNSSSTFTSSTLANADAVTCLINIAGGTCLSSSASTSTAINITVNSLPPAPTITEGTATVICSGGTVPLTSSSSNGNQWIKDGVAITSATGTTYIANSNGTYSAKVTSNGCTTSTSNSIIVSFPTTPPPTITSFTPTTGLPGTVVIITGTNFSSTPADNTVSFNGVLATVTAASTSSLTVVVPMGAETGTFSVKICNQVTVSAELFVVPDQTIQINDLITPFNRDGINDQLKIVNIHLTFKNKVTLLDRYGVVVKQWEDFRNFDDPINPKPDSFDFSQFDKGHYICILEYQLVDGGFKQELTQVITLLK